MGIIHVQIQGNTHTINCDDGQEEHVKFLAKSFNTKIENIAASQKGASDLTLYLLAALILSDELEETKAKLLRKSPESSNEQAIAQTLDSIIDYIENLAIKLEK